MYFIMLWCICKNPPYKNLNFSKLGKTGSFTDQWCLLGFQAIQVLIFLRKNVLVAGKILMVLPVQLFMPNMDVFLLSQLFIVS